MIVLFDGSSFQNVHKWLKYFEDVANTLNLIDLHKLIFAKCSIIGKAKLKVQSETKINRWKKFKQILHKFCTVCNSATLHEMLSKRKMKNNDTVQEYFLIMKLLRSHGNVEDDALMQYVINGINDSVLKNHIYRNVGIFEEFKQKLKVHEKV